MNIFYSNKFFLGKLKVLGYFLNVIVIIFLSYFLLDKYDGEMILVKYFDKSDGEMTLVLI